MQVSLRGAFMFKKIYWQLKIDSLSLKSTNFFDDIKILKASDEIVIDGNPVVIYEK